MDHAVEMASAPADDELARLRDDVGKLRDKVKALDEAEKREEPRWLRVGTGVVAILAFTFSLFTTYFSYQQTQLQQIHNDRTELRGLLQRLAALPREEQDIRQQFTNQQVANQLAGQLQAENGLLSRQAMEIMGRLPDEYVITGEYVLVANGLIYSGLFTRAEALFDAAQKKVRDATDGVAVYHGMAQLRFAQGDVAGGRSMYQQALQIFDRFPPLNDMHRARLNAQTEINWTDSEAKVGQCNEARQHQARAVELSKQLMQQGDNVYNDALLAQLAAVVDRCAPRPSASIR